jgi:hypothetical protein
MLENRHIRRLNLRQHSRGACGGSSRSNPLILIVALLALAVQLFVVQTHVHRDPAFASVATPDVTPASSGDIQNAASGSAHPDQFPAKDDPSDCPLCQAFAHSGTALHAVALPGWVSTFTVERAFSSGAPIQADLHVSHSWFGRAPPVSSVPA